MSKGEILIRGMIPGERWSQGEHEKKYLYAIGVATECRVLSSMSKGEIFDRLGWF
jgi:hypothetical protein